nr:RNA-directed DNA polymerase, eukaryota, reverse transcriptase zinc-binding domain protein [Tanacetum cinerariifolium]
MNVVDIGFVGIVGVVGIVEKFGICKLARDVIGLVFELMEFVDDVVFGLDEDDEFDDVLRKFGFGDKWCKWIQCCLRSSRGSVIVNDSPMEEFQFDKGLKQGDPLSPFLFILVMESLHLSFQRIVDAGMFHGIKLREDLVNLSHMFYADDAVFVGQWCDSNITTLIHVLECFHKVSSLRINMSKSKIMGVHVDDDRVDRAAVKLGYLVLKTPFSYLGSIVGGYMSRKQSWIDIAERDTKRLSKWKMNTLSIGGRLTLVKSVLGSMPIFHFPIFKSPMGVLNTLEGIRSQFFNGHNSNSKKVSWMNWKKVLLSKDRGGLGVSSLYAMNRGMLFKWVWRIGATLRGGISSCWTTIIQEMNALAMKGIDLMKYMSINWEMVRQRNSGRTSVGVQLAQPNLSFSFRLKPRGGYEQVQFYMVEDLVKTISLTPISDRWKWELESSGDFSVASVRNLIDSKMLPNLEYKSRWINYVPIKVNVHAWKIMTDSMPTRFNISRRGICIDSILCAICDTGVETVRHLFFSCGMARDVVNLITRWWNLLVAKFVSYDEWLAWLVNVRLPSKNKKMLEGVFYVMWWLLWWFRNKSIFEGKAPKKAMFFDDLVFKSFNWCRYRCKKSF